MLLLFVASAMASTPDAALLQDGRAVLTWALGDAWAGRQGDLVTPAVHHAHHGERVDADLHVEPELLAVDASGALQVTPAVAAQVVLRAPHDVAQVAVRVHSEPTVDGVSVSTVATGHIGSLPGDATSYGRPWHLAADLPLGGLTSRVELSLQHDDGWTLSARTHTAPAPVAPVAPEPCLMAEVDGHPLALPALTPRQPMGMVTGWAIGRLAALGRRVIPTLFIG